MNPLMEASVHPETCRTRLALPAPMPQMNCSHTRTLQGADLPGNMPLLAEASWAGTHAPDNCKGAAALGCRVSLVKAHSAQAAAGRCCSTVCLVDVAVQDKSSTDLLGLLLRQQTA